MSEATKSNVDDVLASASGFAPDARQALTASELINPKKFEQEFTSPAWPEYNGKVVIRYPSMGDMLRIEAIVGNRSGQPFWELFATLQVCLEQAPHAWYHLPKGEMEPRLALEAFQDSEGLFELWLAYLDWRRSFRRRIE